MIATRVVNAAKLPSIVGKNIIHSTSKNAHSNFKVLIAYFSKVMVSLRCITLN